MIHPNPSSQMEQDAPSGPASIADHPSPPSRLLSKHRPRRRAAVPRPPLPPPEPPAHTRGQPDLNLCHCCGVRFPPPQPGSKRRSVRPLISFWRVVLLCTECLSLNRSGSICPYCLSLDNLLPEDGSAVACRRCRRCVHRSCIPGEHRTALIQPVELDNFLCVDCCPTLRSKNGGINLGLSLEAYTRDTTSVEGGNVWMKNGEVKSASKRRKDVLALTGIGGGRCDRRGGGDPALPDGELALQLHLAMNGSQRISRSGNPSGGSSAEQDKETKYTVGLRNGEQEICVTNMMAQLDDESEQACSKVPYRTRRSTPLATVVLALECVKGKRTHKSMEAKRKNPPETRLQDDLVGRYKNKYYSKRNSGKQMMFENVVQETMHDRKDIDDDRGGSGAAPVK